jgi:predicted enzyme related to lactoylglutathione lyase
MKDFAKTVKNHWDGILNAFDSKLTNGRVEAANGQIQAAKAKARGYGTVRHLITIADLVAGKLTHLPACPFENRKCANPSA